MIRILRAPASPEQIEERLQPLSAYVQRAVDVERGALAGDGVMHADCESALLEDGRAQDDIWGADWDPASQQVTFESLVNPPRRQNNPSLEILGLLLRQRVSQIVRDVLEQP